MSAVLASIILPYYNIKLWIESNYCRFFKAALLILYFARSKVHMFISFSKLSHSYY